MQKRSTALLLIAIAALAIILQGASGTASAVIEGFVLWSVAYLRTLVEAVMAILVTFLIAAHVKGRLGVSRMTDNHG